MILHDFKKIKTFESFQIVDPIYWGHELGSREINYLEQYGVYCPEYIRTDDGYYYIGKYRCDHIKDVPEAYIHYICDINSIKKYTINPDFSVDVNNDVELYNKGKLPINFNKVKGNFTCRLNRLTTLKGAPREVFRNFSCSDNKLTTLLGGPNDVGGSFNCSNNELTTLEGAPYNASTTWGGYFNCDNNKLVSLLGAPKVDLFSCSGNPVDSLLTIFKGDYIWLLNSIVEYGWLHGTEVIKHRLVDVFLDEGKPAPNLSKIDSIYELR